MSSDQADGAKTDKKEGTGLGARVGRGVSYVVLQSYWYRHRMLNLESAVRRNLFLVLWSIVVRSAFI